MVEDSHINAVRILGTPTRSEALAGDVMLYLRSHPSDVQPLYISVPQPTGACTSPLGHKSQLMATNPLLEIINPELRVELRCDRAGR